MIEPKVAVDSESIADHYDELDRWYRMIWGEHVHHGLWLTGRESTEEATRALSMNLAMKLSIQDGQRVCDIGCGYGATARLLAREFNASVTGMTLSEAQYAEAQADNGAEGAPLILHQDFLDNDLPEESFDAAISIESSEHFPDKPALFQEANRILRPGGRIGVYAWLASDGARPWQIRHILEPICREGRLPGLGTEQDYTTWLIDAGFQEIVVKDYTRNVRRTWPIIVGRLAKRLLWDRAAWAFLFSGARNIEFGKTVFRIWLGYHLGCLRYGLFTASKPESA